MSFPTGSFAAFDPPTSCTGSPDGAKALAAYLLDRFEWAFSLGICNCRPVRGGSTYSHHAACRAFDLGVPLLPGGKPNTELGDAVVRLLLPHCKRLGIDHIIWNRQIWSASSPNGRYYGGVHPHYDHIHIGLNANAGAKLNYATLVAVLGSTEKTRFPDVPAEHWAYDSIEWLAEKGITRPGTYFNADGVVTRGQMAAFLVRALRLPRGSASFVDTKGHLFESEIAAIASAGITRGTNPPRNDRFSPDAPVTRGQVAAFLNRALRLPAGARRFEDCRGHIFEADIAALAAAGIAKGVNPPANTLFEPDRPLTRAQMAALLHRALA